MTNPINEFQKFWNLAHKKKEATADYLSLATVDAKGKPHVRTVLIKAIDKNGVSFVTQALGPKVKQMKLSRVECCVAWPKLHLQVRLSGKVKPMPKKFLKILWGLRPREAQILYSLGIAQSSPIPSYEFLLNRVTGLAVQWRRKKKIPLSPYYVGFIVEPKTIEFLNHNPSRLNRRELYQKTSRGWRKTFLAP